MPLRTPADSLFGVSTIVCRWSLVLKDCWQGLCPWRGITNSVMSVATDRFTATGDGAGTPPGDRRFRPDVQGMRAIAILLAIVYHAGLPGFSGGYVGIEVFFVISGFVITGLLLRERETTGRTSILSFYGRRARRIIPARRLSSSSRSSPATTGSDR